MNQADFFVPIPERRKYVETTVTLNGVKAVIRGALLDFAYIHADDGRSAEFAWDTVRRVICEKNGAFLS